jgi:hypothetical protein
MLVLFVPFQMVETKWPPIRPPFCFYHLKTGHSCPVASLDCFGMKKIFFMTLFFIKQSRLVPTIQKPDNSPVFKWSDIQMPGTGIRLNPNTDCDLVFGGQL